MENRVYVASRASVPERAEMWRRLRSDGWPIISTWIDEDGPGQTADMGELWSRIEGEVTTADGLVLYVEPEDFPLKGALVEVGMALAAKVPVVVVAPFIEIEPKSCRPVGSWMRHPLVSTADGAASAFRLLGLRPDRRKAFTLIEVLIAILIVGVLVAILLPAVNAAMRTARRASVVAEIGMLQQSIDTFKISHNIYPPSRFVCSESGDYSLPTLLASGSLRDEIAIGSFGIPWASLSAPQQAAATTTIDRLRRRTVGDMAGLWPSARVNLNGPQQNIPAIGFYDFNGNGRLDGPFLLDGTEALVFFLGGIPKPFATSNGATGFGCIGWSTYPKNPFLPQTYLDASGNAVVPPRSNIGLDFRTERLVDSDGDGVPWYADSFSGSAFPTPYVYFCTIGNLYDPDDVNFAAEPDGSPSPSGGFVIRGFALDTPFVSSPSPNPYTINSPYPHAGVTDPAYQSNWAAETTYQIISAGQDRQFGPGGWWDSFAKTTTKVPFDPAGNQAITGVLLGKDARFVERDNISNFATGPLD